MAIIGLIVDFKLKKISKKFNKAFLWDKKYWCLGF